MYKFVIAGGWSVSQYDTRYLYQFGNVIGINDAALWTNVNTCLTMDRLWFENRWPYLKARRVDETWVRLKCDCNVIRKTKQDHWLTFTHFNKPGLSETTGELWGSNSGTCGINLAYQEMADNETLFLLGFDMQRGPGNEPYWYPSYPWAKPEGGTGNGKYKEWAVEFEAILQGFMSAELKIYNVTNRSAITSIPKISFNEMMEIIG